jgi:hypothetical protein
MPKMPLLSTGPVSRERVGGGRNWPRGSIFNFATSAPLFGYSEPHALHRFLGISRASRDAARCDFVNPRQVCR